MIQMLLFIILLIYLISFRKFNNVNLKHNILIYFVLFLSGIPIFLTTWLQDTYGIVQNGALTIMIPHGLHITTILSFFLYCVLPFTILPICILLLHTALLEISKNSKKLRNIFKGGFCVSTLGNSILYGFPVIYGSISIYASIEYITTISITNLSKLGCWMISAKPNLPFSTISGSKILSYSLLLCFVFTALLLLFNISIENRHKDDEILKKSIGKKIVFILFPVLICIMFLSYLSAIWVLNTFGTIAVDQLIFQLKVPLQGTNTDFYISFIIQCILPSLFFSAIIFLAFYPILKKWVKINITLQPISKMKITVPIHKNYFYAGGFFILIFAISSNVSNFSEDIGIPAYVKSMQSDSDFIDTNYVSPQETMITFPDHKRNLIYIFMESMENTYMSYELGGAQKNNLIPELTQIAQENSSFSNTNAFGGPIQLSGTGWTIAAMTSQHMGIPLNIPIDGNNYGQYETFMPGAFGLGDILQREGYNQTLIVGSDAEYGGRKSLYTGHGNYKVLDLHTAWEDGIVPDGRTVFWGFEDVHLYEYAKRELKQLSQQDKPFNLTMLTVDTHHVGGYRCSLCRNEYSEQYWDVIRCASRQLQSFLSWIEVQSFYKDTTIVVVGDHHSMDTIVPNSMPENYQRTVYNAFINSTVETTNLHNRLFAPMDLFPTTLASLGATIEGDRLALGTNLFSQKSTLLEEYGIKAVQEGLAGYSKRYKSLLYG